MYNSPCWDASSPLSSWSSRTLSGITKSTNLNNKIAIIVSTPFVIKVFLVDQINEMAKIYDVTVILNLAYDKALLEGISD